MGEEPRLAPDETPTITPPGQGRSESGESGSQDWSPGTSTPSRLAKAEARSGESGEKKTLGAFEIIEEIGRCGMGIAYKACRFEEFRKPQSMHRLPAEPHNAVGIVKRLLCMSPVVRETPGPAFPVHACGDSSRVGGAQAV